MIWGSAQEFFAMNGYALYIWGAVIVTVGCLLAEVVVLTLWRRLVLQYLSALPHKEPESQPASSQNSPVTRRTSRDS